GHYGAQQNDKSSQNEARQEAEVLAGHDGVGRQTEEHQGGHAQCHGNQLATVIQRQVGVEQWAQGVAHEPSQGKSQDQAPAGVTGLMNAEQQSIESDKGDDQTRMA